MGLRLTQGDEKRGPVQEPHSMEAPSSPLSSRPERSVVERSAVSADLSWKCFSTGEVMGERPTQGDEKRVLFSKYCCWKRRPLLCHLDRSAAQWRDLRFQRSRLGNVFRQGPVQQLLLLEAPPSPLSSRPERSVVERSAFSAVSSWKCFSTRSCSATTVAGSAALPFVISTGAQRSGEICGVSGLVLEMFFDKVLFSNYCCWKRGPPLCHLDRSAAQWRDLRSSGPFLGMFFDRAQRSGEIYGVSG